MGWINPAMAVCLFLGLFLAACQAPVAADTEIADLQDRLRLKLEEYRERHNLPGASLGFTLSDGRPGAVAVGLADKENVRFLDVTDRLLSGSVGKTYVSAVVLQLAGEKALDLDDPIGKWLADEPWFDRLPNCDGITVRMLMNHTSGIPEYIYHPDIGRDILADPDHVWKPEERLAYILDQEPLFPPEKGWAYADANYIVLGIIIEKETGRSYYSELERRILRPLGLNDTVPADSRAVPGLIPGYAGRKNPFEMTGRTIRDGKFAFNTQLEWTGGGLASTPRDLARWTRAVYRGEAFPPELMQTMLEGKPTGWAEGDRYGLGVQIWPSRLGVACGHGGWFPGYLSLMAYYKDPGVSVALQVNSDAIEKSSADMRLFLEEVGLILDGRG